MHHSPKFHSVAWVIFLGALLFFGVSCKEKESARTLFTLQKDTEISFVNEVKNTTDYNIFSYRNFYNGGGVAIGDINNDGLADVFFTSNMGANKLYLNKGNWQFEDISEKAGIEENGQWSTGVVMVDINHDGWLDIYVCNAGFINGRPPVSRMFINNKDNTFTDAAAAYNLTNEGGYATHAAFFDYDLDGDLDVFIINNSFIPVNTLNYANKRDLRAKDWPVADYLKGGGDRFLRNDNGTFVDISAAAGIYGSLISFGLGVTVGDVNGDHYPDVYVSNDFFERDYLYINQRNGTFKDELEEWVQHLSNSSMGADMADINNDGYPDLFVTEMLPDDDYRLKTTTSFENVDVHQLKVRSGFYYQYMQNTLQVNRRNGKFSETAFYSGVAASDWSWGGLIFDADNDGLSDLYVCNGIYNDVTNQDFIDFFANEVIQQMVMTGKKEQFNEIIGKMPSQPLVNKFFHNEGRIRFRDRAKDWGLSIPSFSNGAAYGDLDNDGDLDLVVNNVNEEAFVYRNNSSELGLGRHISLNLKGRGANTYAIGSIVKLYCGGEVLMRELIPSRGFQSSVDYKMNFGLGQRTVDSLVVEWPDRSITRMEKPAADSTYQLEWPAGGDIRSFVTVSERSAVPLLERRDAPFDRHQEDAFLDAYYDKNLPQLLTNEGPRAAVGDLNKDGREDVFIGAASGKVGQLYLQTPSGFRKKPIPDLERYAAVEETAVLFFDADKDGDPDLFVGAGGNNRNPGSSDLVNRLFINNGKGDLTYDSTALPFSGTNNAVVLDWDFDNDGDLDLFAGSRSISLDYGPSPQSFLLSNDGKGRFTDVTAQLAPALQHIGMVTGAQLIRLGKGKPLSLAIVGEWMAPVILTWNGSRLEVASTSLGTLNGWWQTLAAGDLDGDGDDDLVLGNMGENFYLQADASAPLKLWIRDFDHNGSQEKIITRTVGGRDMPVFLKKELTEQVLLIKKQNLRYEDYGKRSMQDLFDAPSIDAALKKEITVMYSCIAYNEGGGKFTVERLPMEMQWSCLNAIRIVDMDSDGKKDILAGGNNFRFLPQFGRLDASFGHVLLQKEARRWQEMPSSASGLLLRGQVRDIQPLSLNGQPHWLFLQNDDLPVLMRWAVPRRK